jgi:hypothetical protein
VGDKPLFQFPVAAAQFGAERGATQRTAADALVPGKSGQVDPIKPTLNAPGSMHLKLEHDNLLFKF